MSSLFVSAYPAQSSRTHAQIEHANCTSGLRCGLRRLSIAPWSPFRFDRHSATKFRPTGKHRSLVARDTSRSSRPQDSSLDSLSFHFRLTRGGESRRLTARATAASGATQQFNSFKRPANFAKQGVREMKDAEVVTGVRHSVANKNYAFPKAECDQNSVHTLRHDNVLRFAILCIVNVEVEKYAKHRIHTPEAGDNSLRRAHGVVSPMQTARKLFEQIVPIGGIERPLTLSLGHGGQLSLRGAFRDRASCICFQWASVPQSTP